MFVLGEHINELAVYFFLSFFAKTGVTLCHLHFLQSNQLIYSISRILMPLKLNNVNRTFFP